MIRPKADVTGAARPTLKSVMSQTAATAPFAYLNLME
jgi:hypothetical protein